MRRIDTEPLSAPPQLDEKLAPAGIGIVVIGRNEGERLKRCLDSAVRYGLPVVYVDSGSTDPSVLIAREFEVDVVELDDSAPFTAARARNAGFDRLLATHAGIEFVQFVDGDCELHPGWLGQARAALAERGRVAIVCGRVRERCASVSIYNRICEMEWKQPLGEIESCGGNMLVRAGALDAVGGFDPAVIAAEDTDLCARLRLNGYKVVSIAADMVAHDAAMLRFWQWWWRNVRAGHAMTEGADRHGRSPGRLFVRATRRIGLYGLVLPLLALGLVGFTRGWSFLLLGVYLLQLIKNYAVLRRRGERPADAMIYAGHCVAAKFPQAWGQLIYRWNQLRRRRTRLIEHKGPASAWM